MDHWINVNIKIPFEFLLLKFQVKKIMGCKRLKINLILNHSEFQTFDMVLIAKLYKIIPSKNTFLKSLCILYRYQLKINFFHSLKKFIKYIHIIL